jgi:hypothetical protein
MDLLQPDLLDDDPEPGPPEVRENSLPDVSWPLAHKAYFKFITKKNKEDVQHMSVEYYVWFGCPTLPLFICQPSQIKLDFKLNSTM